MENTIILFSIFYFRKGLKRIVDIGLTGTKGQGTIRNDKERQGISVAIKTKGK
jgi:hypothetical protein